MVSGSIAGDNYLIINMSSRYQLLDFIGLPIMDCIGLVAYNKLQLPKAP